MYRNWSFFALLGCANLLSGCASISGDAAPQKQIRSETAKSSWGTGPVMRAAHAISIGQQGEKNADADALRTAAQTLESLGARPEADQGEDLSRRWGKQAQLIDPSAAPPVYRGRALGPSYKKGQVSSLSTVSTDQIFLAGKKASVALVPVSSQPLSITISDGQGKNICNRSTSSRPANCQWLPLFTERYRINIQNSARQPVSYYLVSN